MLVRSCLNSSWQEDDILHEAYLLTRDRIERGEEIQSIPVHLKGVCFSIIQDKNKQIQLQLQALEEFVKATLSNSIDEDLPKLLLFIKRSLRQFHLDSLQEGDIFNEAYLRTRKQMIEEGKKINNIPAYLRVVCLNIIREHSRKNKRHIFGQDNELIQEKLFAIYLLSLRLLHITLFENIVEGKIRRET